MRSKNLKQSKAAPQFRFTMASKDLPATQGMLHLVKGELKHESKALKHEMMAGFSRVDAQFSEVNSKLERVLSEVARVGVLVEEQHSDRESRPFHRARENMTVAAKR